MKIHILIALGVGVVFKEATTTTLDLHAAAGLGLDVFNVAPALSDDLCAQIEAWDWLKVDWDTLFRPLAPALVVALEGRAVTFARGVAAKAALVHEIRQVDFHQLFNFLDSFLETFFGCRGDVEIEWGVLCMLIISTRCLPRTQKDWREIIRSL